MPATTTKQNLVSALVGELDQLKGRMERVRLSGASAPQSNFDKAAYVILRRLEAAGPARLSTVAHHFGLDVSTISRHVASLEDDGLIERIADPADGRAQLLQLTAAGHEKHRLVQDNKAAVIGEQLADWTKSDCAQFVELLGRYNSAMEQRFGAPQGEAK